MAKKNVTKADVVQQEQDAPVAVVEAPVQAPAKKTNLELVEAKFPEKFGKTRSIGEIATEGKKTYFRVNYYDPSVQKFTSYWIAVENGEVKNETK